jgi:mRNA-degrading endonuclease RelE of RelBE toxin-antitoxin system
MVSQSYKLVYAKAVTKHLEAIEAKHHSHILAKIEEQLCFQPEVQTRNRKPLQQPATFGATWEIRFGPGNSFRVLYDVDRESYVVHILGIGVKSRERLLFAGEEVRI